MQPSSHTADATQNRNVTIAASRDSATITGAARILRTIIVATSIKKSGWFVLLPILYAHWEITEIFSVTVPVVLPLTVDENGEVHTGSAEIINGSTGEVVVSSVSISTKNGWQIVPYATDMAHEKVDAQLLGFKINGAQTTKNGNAETFALSAPWEITENGRLPISYDAVVSAVSKAITEQEVLSVVFVLEWGGE